MGFIGIVGANAAYVAPNKTPIRFSAPDDGTEQDTAATLPLIVQDVQPVVDQLRNEEQVDLVIGLSHSGMLKTATEKMAITVRLFCIDNVFIFFIG